MSFYGYQHFLRPKDETYQDPFCTNASGTSNSQLLDLVKVGLGQ